MSAHLRSLSMVLNLDRWIIASFSPCVQPIPFTNISFEPSSIDWPESVSPKSARRKSPSPPQIWRRLRFLGVFPAEWDHPRCVNLSGMQCAYPADPFGSFRQLESTMIAATHVQNCRYRALVLLGSPNALYHPRYHSWRCLLHTFVTGGAG